MYFLESYLTFLLQNRLSYPKADDSGETIVGQNEIIFKYSPTWDVYIKLLVLFFSVGFASKILYRTVFLDVFNKLDDTKRFELPSYCLSMFHHSYVTVLGFFQIHSLYSNFVRHIEPDSVIIKSMIEPVPVVVAYIVADIYFYAFPEFIRTKRWDFLLHHVASIAGLAGFLQSPVIPTYRLLPHAMICELSGLFMAVGWFMK